MVLLVITVIRWNKIEADRKAREKKWFPKSVSEIQKQEDFGSTPLYNHKLQGIIKRTLETIISKLEIITSRQEEKLGSQKRGKRQLEARNSVSWAFTQERALRTGRGGMFPRGQVNLKEVKEEIGRAQRKILVIRFPKNYSRNNSRTSTKSNPR